MDTMQSEVNAALILTGYPVAYQFPDETRTFPSITYYESENRVLARADGVEYATEVQYVVDVWATIPETLVTVALSVDTRLAALGLNREFSHDLFETDTGIHHKNMRYRAVIHIAEQKIYQ